MKDDIAALGILCAFMIGSGFFSYALLALIIKIGGLI